MVPLQWALLSPVSKQILRIFHGHKNRGEDIFYKQATLAEMIGCRREQVNRCIAELTRRGFIQKKSRHSRFIVYLLLLLSITPERPPRITSQPRSPLYELSEPGSRQPRKKTAYEEGQEKLLRWAQGTGSYRDA